VQGQQQQGQQQQGQQGQQQGQQQQRQQHAGDKEREGSWADDERYSWDRMNDRWD
jgi:hypothetical protein